MEKFKYGLDIRWYLGIVIFCSVIMVLGLCRKVFLFFEIYVEERWSVKIFNLIGLVKYVYINIYIER